jgi:N-acetylmuramic acid 6-phosphate etherase
VSGRAQRGGAPRAPVTPMRPAVDVRTLATETVRPELHDIDLASTEELVRLMNREDRTVPVAVGLAAADIAVAVDAIAERLADGGRMIYVGAGTSGRMGLLDAAECGPTFNTEPGQVAGILAGGRDAFAEADEGAEDDAEAGARAIAEHGVGPADAVVGITASGRTPYVLGAMRAARARGAVTVGLSCNLEAALSAEVDYAIEVDTGPELIAGSTRLKAGTAQKLVLNMLSTVTMVRLGKTYGNLMVDVRATNAKLRERATLIVEQVADVDARTARRALAACGQDTKAAIVCLLAGVEPDEAARRLAAAGGRLRDALRGA